MTEPKKPINFFETCPHSNGMVTRKNPLQLTFALAGTHAALAGNPQVSCSNTKSPTLTMDRGHLEPNRAPIPFASAARNLGKRRPEK
jgi:hypothetical protein